MIGYLFAAEKPESFSGRDAGAGSADNGGVHPNLG